MLYQVFLACGIAGSIGRTAATLGYGRRRRVVRRRMTGGSFRSILSGVHNFVKKNQLVSKGLNQFGYSKLASAASSLGYGRRHRRRTVRRRVRVGVSRIKTPHHTLRLGRTVVRRRTTRRRRVGTVLVRRRAPRRIIGMGNFFTESQLAAPKF